MGQGMFLILCRATAHWLSPIPWRGSHSRPDLSLRAARQPFAAQDVESFPRRCSHSD